MKTVLAKEIIKNRYRKIAAAQAREYYLTHDCFSGRRLRTPYQHQPTATDPRVTLAQQDLKYLNALLYPQPTLGNTLSASLAALRLAPVQATPLPDAMLDKPSTDLIRRMTTWYDRYLAEGVSGLLSEQPVLLSPANLDVIKQAYPNQMILVQNICILCAFWIRSPKTWPPDGTVSLLEHLFVRYSAPVFLKQCWLQTLSETQLRWLLVYLAYVQGASLKQLGKHFDWQVDNLKLWHELPRCKAGLAPQDAVMYTEVMRLGGSEAQFELLMANAAYRIDVLSAGANTHAFWYSMVQWLAQHRDTLVGVEYDRVLAWARHQFTEQSATGKVFSMQGRSFAKVLRQAHDYHRALEEEQEEIARRIEIRRLALIAREEQTEEAHQRVEEQVQGLYRWEAQGWNWELDDYEIFQVWRFTELTSTEALHEEGNAMRHCVGGYSYDCYTQSSAIISLRCDELRCLTIELNLASKTVVQMSGYQNRDATEQETKAVQLWLEHVVGTTLEHSEEESI